MENGAKMGECLWADLEKSDSLGILGEGLREVNEILKLDEGGKTCWCFENWERDSGRSVF